jgi:hypothetical protein
VGTSGFPLITFQPPALLSKGEASRKLKVQSERNLREHSKVTTIRKDSIKSPSFFAHESRDTFMPTTKSRSTDRRLVSNEAYEVEYIHKQFPKNSHQEVQKAIDQCKAALKGSEAREKIMACLRGKLK